jgi:uncharacterized Zn finger protein
MFDEVNVPCPRCGIRQLVQSKGGGCSLARYELEVCPQDVLGDVNRYAPFSCDECGAVFSVRLVGMSAPC